MKETLNPKVLASMNQWFTDRGIFDRLQKAREEAEQKKGGENLSCHYKKSQEA
ncbi:hypothetical protein [Pseudobacillus badius]|uniref:hypothetical protein n=1 Tax=Bacillus badius TaxID=1455 RepID=UPI0012E7F832|nr:hypothetical protein [Bacillus badius]